jgi:hypothetical protein
VYIDDNEAKYLGGLMQIGPRMSENTMSCLHEHSGVSGLFSYKIVRNTKLYDDNAFYAKPCGVLINLKKMPLWAEVSCH